MQKEKQDDEHDSDKEETEIWRPHYQCCNDSVEGRLRRNIEDQLNDFNEAHSKRRQDQLQGS